MIPVQTTDAFHKISVRSHTLPCDFLFTDILVASVIGRKLASLCRKLKTNFILECCRNIYTSWKLRFLHFCNTLWYRGFEAISILPHFCLTFVSYCYFIDIMLLKLYQMWWWCQKYSELWRYAALSTLTYTWSPGFQRQRSKY